ATPLPDGTTGNGFIALSQYDDNRDGVIDARDMIWTRLLAWTDGNHNGLTDHGELTPLSATAIKAIQLDYHLIGRRDSSGNFLRYKARAIIETPDGQRSEPIFDVYFAAQH
ncbi:MAG: hypothetical protein ACREMY_19810, partial [bacterium]